LQATRTEHLDTSSTHSLQQVQQHGPLHKVYLALMYWLLAVAVVQVAVALVAAAQADTSKHRITP
jgi:hypothetical protein